jgi:hypothetical protein
MDDSTTQAITPGWRFVAIVIEGRPVPGLGFDPWPLEWRDVKEVPIVVAHPQYPLQRHSMWIYDVETKGRIVRFAAGEFSANVWGFYVPAVEDEHRQ